MDFVQIGGRRGRQKNSSFFSGDLPLDVVVMYVYMQERVEMTGNVPCRSPSSCPIVASVTMQMSVQESNIYYCLRKAAYEYGLLLKIGWFGLYNLHLQAANYGLWRRVRSGYGGADFVLSV